MQVPHITKFCLGWPSGKQRLANKSIILPLCPQWQIAQSLIHFSSGAMLLGNKPKGGNAAQGCNHETASGNHRAKRQSSTQQTSMTPLCWFQTLAARRFAAWSSLVVSELQLSAATPLWLFTERQSLPSWIEFNCLWSATVGKAARLSIYWLDAACRLVIPLRQVTLAQLN